MPATDAFVSFAGGPLAGALAMLGKVFLTALLLAAVFAAGRWHGADARLAHARRQTADVTGELNRVLAELAVNRDAVSRLEHSLAENNESTRVGMAMADQRLAEAQRAVAHAEASALARDTRIRALLIDDRRFGESRCKVANRLITDALSRNNS